MRRGGDGWVLEAAAVSPDDVAHEPAETRPAIARQRSVGRIAARFVASGGRTRLDHLEEAGPLRLRMPRGDRHLHAVLLNTGGGVACGDRATISVHAGNDSDIVVTSQAAERIYRSDGPVSEICTLLDVDAGGRLHWLPQETILYDQACVRRRFEVDVAEGGSLLSCESLVFGRAAHGETMRAGLLHDVWRVRSAGRLVYADSLHLDGTIAETLARPAVAGGARALATLLYVAADAETRLDEARARLASTACESGASAWRGFLVVRFLSPEIGLLRLAVADFLAGFTGRPMPRVWML
jgi:urease accessory protein